MPLTMAQWLSRLVRSVCLLHFLWLSKNNKCYTWGFQDILHDHWKSGSISKNLLGDIIIAWQPQKISECVWFQFNLTVSCFHHWEVVMLFNYLFEFWCPFEGTTLKQRPVILMRTHYHLSIQSTILECVIMYVIETLTALKKKIKKKWIQKWKIELKQITYVVHCLESSVFVDMIAMINLSGFQ